MIDRLVAEMTADKGIVMAFPDDPNEVGWQSNETIAKEWAERLGLKHPLPKYFLFPIGNMFWARAEVISPLLKLDLDWNDYPEEPLPYDGTLLHTLERLIGLLGRRGPNGFVATLHTPRVKR